MLAFPKSIRKLIGSKTMQERCMHKIFLFLIHILAAGLLAACSPQQQEAQFFATDVTGADFARDFKLTDHTGKPRTLADFKGKAVALFFGYTHCPDVCPTTMADMAKAMKLLGERSNEVQVLFVTVDPERDTQPVLAEYVPFFDPRFLGLYGTPEQTDTVIKDFKVFYAKQDAEGKSDYTVDHSAGTYAYDKSGNIRLYFKYGQKPEEIAHDLKQIL
jgi:protein SCO1/2